MILLHLMFDRGNAFMEEAFALNQHNMLGKPGLNVNVFWTGQGREPISFVYINDSSFHGETKHALPEYIATGQGWHTTYVCQRRIVLVHHRPKWLSPPEETTSQKLQVKKLPVKKLPVRNSHLPFGSVAQELFLIDP